MSTPVDTPEPNGLHTPGESGMVLVVMLIVMLPLAIAAGAASTLMQGRNGRLLAEVQGTRAFFAAEAGIDDAMFRIADGTLVSGAVTGRTIAPGLAYEIDPMLLSTDGIDNDGDTQVDEGDEEVYRLVVTGTFGVALRRIVAMVRDGRPAGLEGAITLHAPPTDFAMSGSSHIDGANHDVDYTLGDPADSVHGLVIAPPDPVASVTSVYAPSGSSSVTGTSPTPSIAQGTYALDVDALAQWVRDNATMTLADGFTINTPGYGDASLGDFRVIHAVGRLNMSGGGLGAGILLVEGDKLGVSGDSYFDGIVILLGAQGFAGSGGTHITGGMVFGAGALELKMSGTDTIRYSQPMIDLLPAGFRSLLRAAGPPELEVVGWREIGRT